MMPVNNSHGAIEGSHGSRGEVARGTVGLAIVFALFAVQYPAIATLATDSFGLLSSTAIVWLFVTAWLVCWLGVDLAYRRLSRTRRFAGPARSNR